MPCCRGDAESDDFNRLVMGAGLAWRDVAILRAIGKFLRQAAMTFSLAYMQQALVRNPDVASLLVALFHARNDPRGARRERGQQYRVQSKSRSPRRCVTCRRWMTTASSAASRM